MDKKAIRNVYLKKRDKIHNSTIDKKIINKLFNQKNFIEASSIFVTKSIGSEINTEEIINKSFGLKKRVFIPKINQKTKMLIPVEIKNNYSENLIPGLYQIPEPKELPKLLEIPDLVIVPGLIFSKNGYRLGYGGGYYDRFIEKYSPKTTALVYDEFILEKIPIENFDLPVDQIISEKRIINLK